MSRTSAIWALGAMSGTSLDGVDAAMVLTDGEAVYAFGQTAYRPYSDDERAVLRRAFGQSSGPEVHAAAEVIEIAHVEVLAGFEEAQLVGVHGQTTLHSPELGTTCQIGNGAVIATALDRPVVWDFRTADVRLGGQGAPLAPFYHFALAKYADLSEPVAFLNIGGVANVTWLDPQADRADAPDACLAFDTGPGNALIDDLCAARTGARMDRDGALALAGQVHMDRLEAMLRDRPYFASAPPKSLDRDDFADWMSFVDDLSTEDAIATLTAGTAAAVAHGMDHCPASPARMLVAGGGRKNPAMMDMIAGLLDVPVEPVENLGLDGDMLEAQAFAYLAVRVKKGLPTSAPGTTGVGAPVGGGVLSEPGGMND